MNKSYVYFLRSEATRAIKIGVTRRPTKRMSALQGGTTDKLTLLGMIDGDVQMERSLHAEFAETRISGEWFKETAALIARVDGLLGTYRVEPTEDSTPPDACTKQAAEWARKIEDAIAEQCVCTVQKARSELSAKSGISFGVLRHLRAGRISRISANDYLAIQQAYGECLQSQVDELKHHISEIEAHADKERKRDHDLLTAFDLVQDAEQKIHRIVGHA